MESNVHKNVRVIASFLGIIQGLTYTILSLICIILYNKQLMYLKTSNYIDSIGVLLYNVYLGKDISSFRNQSLRPSVFAGFVWVHFILHLIWTGSSLKIASKSNPKLDKHMKFWSKITWVVCFWDFITVVVAGADYSKCLKEASRSIEIQASCANAILPVLIIAGKGFVLWVVNAGFALTLHRLSQQPQPVGRIVVGSPAPYAYQPEYPAVQSQYPVSQSQYPVSQHQYPVSQPQDPVSQSQYPVAQPNVYSPGAPEPVASATLQNARKNQFDYPVHIPEPDYQYNRQESSAPRRY
jgi:hypothetical protein